MIIKCKLTTIKCKLCEIKMIKSLGIELELSPSHTLIIKYSCHLIQLPICANKSLFNLIPLALKFIN